MELNATTLVLWCWFKSYSAKFLQTHLDMEWVDLWQLL